MGIFTIISTSRLFAIFDKVSFIVLANNNDNSKTNLIVDKFFERVGRKGQHFFAAHNDTVDVEHDTEIGIGTSRAQVSSRLRVQVPGRFRDPARMVERKKRPSR